MGTEKTDRRDRLEICGRLRFGSLADWLPFAEENAQLMFSAAEPPVLKYRHPMSSL